MHEPVERIGLATASGPSNSVGFSACVGLLSILRLPLGRIRARVHDISVRPGGERHDAIRPTAHVPCGIQTIVVAALVFGIPPRASASGAPKMSRVRDNGDPSIAALLQEATAHSPTFRHLVDTIGATNGLVYVEQGRCGHHVRTCLVLTVQVAGPNRLLRILVDLTGAMKNSSRRSVTNSGMRSKR